MMKSNGGGVDVSTDYFELHPFYDTSDKKRIKRTCNSIVHETSNARAHYRLPKNLIVIGNNGGGDHLVYKIESNGSIGNTVYWLDHETEGLVFVANSHFQKQTNRFKCDGRQHCSQMRTFEEADFFLKNCPDTKMDGDKDGIPCERQFNRY